MKYKKKWVEVLLKSVDRRHFSIRGA